jgi:hypothetical protein
MLFLVWNKEEAQEKKKHGVSRKKKRQPFFFAFAEQVSILMVLLHVNYGK